MSMLDLLALTSWSGLDSLKAAYAHYPKTDVARAYWRGRNLDDDLRY
jgi:hypothetical protein